MTASAFDTLAAARELESAGFDRRQAEAIATAVREGQGDLATKADIAILRAAVDRLHRRLDTLQWIVGVQGAVTLATFGIVAAKLL